MSQTDEQAKREQEKIREAKRFARELRAATLDMKLFPCLNGSKRKRDNILDWDDYRNRASQSDNFIVARKKGSEHEFGLCTWIQGLEDFIDMHKDTYQINEVIIPESRKFFLDVDLAENYYAQFQNKEQEVQDALVTALLTVLARECIQPILKSDLLMCTSHVPGKKLSW